MPSFANVLKFGSNPGLQGDYEVRPEYYEGTKPSGERSPLTVARIKFQSLDRPKEPPQQLAMMVSYLEDFAPSEDGENPSKGKGDQGPRGVKLVQTGEYAEMRSDRAFGAFIDSLTELLSPDTLKEFGDDADLSMLDGFRVTMYHEYETYEKDGQQQRRKSPTNKVSAVLWDPFAKEGPNPPGKGDAKKGGGGAKAKAAKDDDAGDSDSGDGAEEIKAVIRAAVEEETPTDRKEFTTAIKKHYKGLDSATSLKLWNSAKGKGPYVDLINETLAELDMKFGDDDSIEAVE